MGAEPTHIIKGILDFVLTHDSDLVEVRVDWQDKTTKYIAFCIDVLLEQHILHLVCRQEVYMKNSVN